MNEQETSAIPLRIVSLSFKGPEGVMKYFNVGEKGVKAINAGGSMYQVWYEEHCLMFDTKLETVQMKCVVDEKPEIQIVRPDQVVGDIRSEAS